MLVVRIAPRFEARLRILSEGRQRYIIARLEWFQRTPDDPQLRLRPLRCMPGFFLIDSIRGDRIVLFGESDGSYVAADCGGHDIITDWERYSGVPPRL